MDASKAHRNKVIQGVKSCINKEACYCKACPYYNNGLLRCDELQEDILRIIRREEIDATDWSGLQEGF